MYSPNEVKEALNWMHPSKASGSDGLPSFFIEILEHCRVGGDELGSGGI